MYVGVYLGGCHLIELNNFSIINFLMLNIQSCRGATYKSNSYLTFLIINNLATGVVTGAVLFPSNKTLKYNAELFVIK